MDDGSVGGGVTRPEGALPGRTVAITLVIALVVWLARPTLLSPLIWLGTYAHESGHATFAELLGGNVVTLTINGRGGGVTYWLAPSDFADWRRAVVASAGYVGAVVVGAVLVVAAARGRNGKVFALVAAGLVLLVAILWVPWNGPEVDEATEFFTGSSDTDGRFTWMFAVFVAAGFVALLWAPTRVRQVVLLFAGATCFLGAIDALRVLIGVSTDGSHNDAKAVNDALGIPTWVVAITWAVVAAGVAFWTIRSLLRAPPDGAEETGVGDLSL
jgi:hypothetical protein